MLKGPNQLDERVPMEVGTIQVNFCKNPQCQNFGIPASTKRQPRGRGAAERGRDTYSVVGSGRGTPMLRCSFCGQYPTIKSNKAIHEELSRFWKPFDTIAIPTCPNQDCPNHPIDREKGKTHYHSFGRTKAGSIRYRCKACGRTFITASSPTIRHRKPYKRMPLFSVFSSTRCLSVVSARWKGSPCPPSTGRSISCISSAYVLQRRGNVIFHPCCLPASISELTGKTI